MDDPRSPPAHPDAAGDLSLPLAWDQLLEQLREVHSQLEYLRLMLKLDRRSQ